MDDNIRKPIRCKDCGIKPKSPHGRIKDPDNFRCRSCRMKKGIKRNDKHDWSLINKLNKVGLARKNEEPY